MLRSQIRNLLIKAGLFPHELEEAFKSYFDRMPEHDRFPDPNKKKPMDRPLEPIVLEQMRKRGYIRELEAVEKAIQCKKIHKRFFQRDVLQKNLDRFFEAQPEPCYTNPHYKAAKQYVFMKLKEVCGEMQPIKLSGDIDLNDLITNPKASAGSIALGKSKGEVLDLVKKVAAHLMENKPEINLPAVLYQRCQISGFVRKEEDGTYTITPASIKYKSRVVWCIDAATILIEGLYARPLMNKLTNMLQYAGGKTDLTIKNLVRAWNRYHWVSLDYSSYDATIPSWLIDDAFVMIKKLFPKSSRDVIDWINHQFVHTTFVDYRGNVRQKHKGVPSGSYFTQIIDSIVNMIVICTFLHQQYGSFAYIEQNIFVDKKMSMCVMGDDNVVFTKVRLNTKRMQHYLKNMFGIKMNAEKVEEGTSNEDVSFLKRKWTEDGGYRDMVELVINMLHPESFRDYKGKGFSPWHVIFGYYLSYPATMMKLFTKAEILKGMGGTKAIEKLESISPSNLPGSLKVHILNNPNYLREAVISMELDVALYESIKKYAV